ncbi:MAG: TIGR00341 family protein, partial [Sulfitobacter sp.]|nr:TIGR00341 family protein [Sulfitobacter sp.]
GAALLLAVNLVCVLLSAKAVFLFKGVKPRTWLERSRAKQSKVIYFSLWATLLLILIVVILLRSSIAD